MAVPFEKILESFTPEQRAEISRRADEIVTESRTVAQLRKSRKVTQQQLAKVLKTSQANVSEIENKEDAMVSTLDRMLKGIGARLALYAEMPDGSSIPLRLAQKKSAEGAIVIGVSRARGAAKAKGSQSKSAVPPKATRNKRSAARGNPDRRRGRRATLSG
jgi:transcriptional regulator with XRE-family HTH domain